MKELGTVRRELGVRTIFNALGPLANPAGASRQVIGAPRPELVQLLADALSALGTERAVVFHSENGLDELTPGVAAWGIEVQDGRMGPWKLEASALSQRVVSLEELRGGDARENAGMLLNLLEGETGPRREAALANAALALVVEGRARDMADGYERARASVDSGAARGVFERLKRAGEAG
jgi:anthranilate phosphoribosyltransferase